MKTWLRLLALGLLGNVIACAESPIDWRPLPALPDAEGFAAPFAGVSGGALLVAGGANIPGDKWREPFIKVWHDSIFVLSQPDATWQRAGTLPRPLGYGISITAGDGLLCFGGSDLTQHYAEAFRLEWRGGAIHTSALPSLPRPCANASGALVGRTIYIAGGIETPASTTALATFWALDLDAAAPRWTELPPCPGEPRMLAGAGAHGGAFYLFSGAKLHAGADGKPAREYLRDAWRFTPTKGWERLADLPRAAVAAPSPALALDGVLLVLTGDDGANVTFQPVKNHPGFPRTTLAYEVRANRWSETGELPFSRATAPIVEWRGGWVLPNGEVRPRVRTAEVWFGMRRR